VSDALPPYIRPAHVAALAAAFGPGHAVLPVAAWDGAAVLLRPIPGTGWHDATGPYPLLPFGTGWDIAAGLAEIAAAGAISLVAVTDPLAPCPAPKLFAHAVPFKRHRLVLGGPVDYVPDTHHRRRLRRAASCELAEVALDAVMPDWLRLYAGLAARRGFAGGMQDFPLSYMASLPPLGLRCFAAREAGAIVAMGLWLQHGDTAWYHLGAADAAGRESGAGHAVMDLAIRRLLADGVTRIVLGGGLATAAEPPCGLDRFKAGFANASRVNLLLGAVLDEARCAALGGATGGGFFPAYRAPPATARAA
jgi:hypothetical protein